MKQLWSAGSARLCDAAMCSMMNALQWRLRSHAVTREEFEAYLRKCSPLTRPEFYAVPESEEFSIEGNVWSWKSPVVSGFAENDRARADFYPCGKGDTAPTMLIFHALMSASDMGYRRLALYLNSIGWNVFILHLPYHYTRRPRRYLNGELAITANLIRNGETLRQGVVEARQLMALLRRRGCTRFGAWATSFGGWIAALLGSVEPDFELVTLMQPIVDVDHALWENPASIVVRRLMQSRGIPRDWLARHAHLSSPLHAAPMGNPEIWLIGGRYDSVSPSRQLRQLAAEWRGSQFLEVDQGHFGYTVMRAALASAEPTLRRLA